MEAYVFFAEGFEELEALSPVDILRRGGITVTMVSVTGKLQVKGANGISVIADKLFEQCTYDNASLLLIPGGMPGTTNLEAHGKLKEAIAEHVSKGKLMAAICAAPRILGKMGLLKGKNATCYPGNEQYLEGATIVPAPVVVDGNIVTAKGVGCAVEFALALVKILKSENDAKNLAARIMFV